VLATLPFTDTGRFIHPEEWIPGVQTLWVAGAISHHPRALIVDATGCVSSPVWSPDGRSFAYIGYCGCGVAIASGGRRAIWSADVAGGTPHFVVDGVPPKAQGSTSRFSAVA
jgi:Tol biopolymer transport system component